VAAARRVEKTRSRLRNAIREGLLDAWLVDRGLESELDRAAEQVLSGGVSPYRAARELIERMTRNGERPN